MRQPIVKELRSKANDLTSKAKAKDFIKCPRVSHYFIRSFNNITLVNAFDNTSDSLSSYDSFGSKDFSSKDDYNYVHS